MWGRYCPPKMFYVAPQHNTIKIYFIFHVGRVPSNLTHVVNSHKLSLIFITPGASSCGDVRPLQQLWRTRARHLFGHCSTLPLPLSLCGEKSPTNWPVYPDRTTPLRVIDLARLSTL